MAYSQNLKTVKLQYRSNGLTDCQEIWHDDDNGPMNLTLPPHALCLLFYVTQLQK